jgi:hypothetical protein
MTEELEHHDKLAPRTQALHGLLDQFTGVSGLKNN